jgi:hypothetical protein
MFKIISLAKPAHLKRKLTSEDRTASNHWSFQGLLGGSGAAARRTCGSLFLENISKFELVPFSEQKINNRVSIIGYDVIVEVKHLVA